ncbi:NAD(P)H-binding protein, PF13460 family [Bacteriovorax sp. BAL6_X]|uniref:NAD(P)H-binding protein n=1 Tax=Bacteriovorax sp. BAL6_X TaxID=1201290 RepID=UPI0003867BE7|nr:NAD(P)H-binding protein [Bacteriovorax sp. BAL6_X]EPZ49977.1 NAD(P)H-binding protein, PF13460 family [Bacteriovorax sp. BAL6_X]
MKVAIAGANGFIGRNLIQKIKGHYHIRALGRSESYLDENIEFSKTDLFSYRSTKEALKDIDIAIYLVHSMLPSSRLFQGSFRDTDLLLADNFAKACQYNGVKHIIYLGGLVPTGESSEHLKSRLEVEEVFKSSGIAYTLLRAGMIVGDGGSSFEILKNLVINLPAMILPKWTKSRTQMVYIDDLLRVVSHLIGNKKFFNRTLNIVNGEDVTYEDLIKKTSHRFRKFCPMIPVPINYLKLSKWWVTIFGESQFELVSPLVDSLKCHLPKVEIEKDIRDLIKLRSYDEMLNLINLRKTKKASHKARRKEEKTVRSIQRLENPSSLEMRELANSYMKWLPRFIRFIIHVHEEEGTITFNIFGLKKPLLILKFIENKSNLRRAKFHIVGGVLSASKDTGWLEFRSVANGKFTLVSINNFRPSLPWYIYCYTQAPIHLFVMRSFSSYLKHFKIS